MGYSARYHAASILAVFAALLIGIVIGAGLGSEVVSDTKTSLEGSLEGDIEEAQAEADALRREADRERSYADRSYPLVVQGRLKGRRVAIIGLGGASVTTTREIEEAVQPAGANLVAVSILRELPDRRGLADALDAGRNAELPALGTVLSRSIARGGGRATEALDVAFSRSSGDLSRLDAVVLVRNGSGPSENAERSAAFEAGFIDGLDGEGAIAVGAERFGQSESAVEWFGRIGADSVDNVEETTGKTSLVFSLRGVQGNFGRKETADRLIPDLLTVAGRAGG